uniref:Uncharacterized protein n=1 Tax=Arundo donax TaxID=35708 RepID=A0A0A9DVX7_ARUDO
MLKVTEAGIAMLSIHRHSLPIEDAIISSATKSTNFLDSLQRKHTGCYTGLVVPYLRKEKLLL